MNMHYLLGKEAVGLYEYDSCGGDGRRAEIVWVVCPIYVRGFQTLFVAGGGITGIYLKFCGARSADD